MNCKKVSSHIIKWLESYLKQSKAKGFVVGVSGGVDSSLVSTLCALTGKPTVVSELIIGKQSGLSGVHIGWLLSNFKNVIDMPVNLLNSFLSFRDDLRSYRVDATDLSMANLQSRLRMCALYVIANSNNYLVAGTGNKVEDFGIGFFTKQGDGGVDISPIGDLYKSEVRELAFYLGVSKENVQAVPTDGLWEDGRSDEKQIGATYDELEYIMKWAQSDLMRRPLLTKRQKQVYKIYTQRHNANSHKMSMPPICEIPEKE